MTIIDDKTPPNAPDMEMAVLGAIMLDTHSFDAVEFLRKEMFYSETNYLIFESFEWLRFNQKPIDILTVTQYFLNRQQLESVGGTTYLTSLLHRIATSVNIEYHARIVQQMWIRRQAIRICNTINSRAYVQDADVFDLMDFFFDKFFTLQNSFTKGAQVQHIKIIADQEKEAFKKRMEAETTGKHSGITTGFFDLDRILGGWQNSELIILAARPSMGKTALALCSALNSAKRKTKICFFSLEMSVSQLIKRALITESGIDSMKYNNSSLGNGEINTLWEAHSSLGALPIYFDDTSGLNISDMRLKAKQAVQRHGIELIFVDYLQLMKGERRNGSNREQEISAISQGLKGLAKELNLPIIALAQLSRDVEKRGGNMQPKLSDLRESGAIEQDADMVLFLHRPKYYGINVDGNGKPTDDVAEIIIAKNRNGATGKTELKWIEHQTKFVDAHETFSPAPIMPNVDFTLSKKEINEDLPF